jgi:hypothetical protein
MLPSNVIDFFLNNQPVALIVQIYSVIRLYIFRTSFFGHHREFSTLHSALVTFMQVSDDRFQGESGLNHQNLHETHQCRMYSGKLVLMTKKDARNV